MIGLLAGAGFSKWAAGLPLAKELFDYNIVPFGPKEEAKLEQVRRLKQEWDARNPGQPTEAFISDAVEGPIVNKELVLWYVVRRLSEPYVWQEWHSGKDRRHVLMIDEKRKYDTPGVVVTRDFLISIAGTLLDGIITTNYDLLFEYALGSKGFNYGKRGEPLYGRGPYPVSTWIKPVVLTGDTPLAKVHGSISWDEKGRYTDGRRGLSSKALIVPPVPNKSAGAELKSQWELAAKILQRSSGLIVFGFAFNQYDGEFLDCLQEYGSSLKNVVLVNPVENLASAFKIWPQANITCVLPPPEGYAELRSWVRDNAIVS